MATVWLLLSRHITTKVKKEGERERRGERGGEKEREEREGGGERD